MNIDELKRNRHHDFQRTINQFDEAMYAERNHASHRRLLKRLQSALYSVNRNDVYYSIANCQQGQRCGSLWCRHCRDQASKAAAAKIFDRVNLMGHGNDDLLHVTAPVGLAQFDIDDVNRVLHQDDLRWKRIRKKNDFWIEAVYEFELVNYHYLRKSGGSDIKKTQMRQMVETQRMDRSEFIFVHWHGVTDLSRKQIDSVFGKEYYIGDQALTKTSYSGLYVQKLHVDRERDYNIRKIGSYPFKSAYRFKHTFKGSDYANGEYFTTDELGRLVALYQDVQGRQWRRLRRHCGRIAD
jgi:hypothetical protein